MRQGKRIRRSATVWRRLFSRQSSSGLSVPAFCRREGVNASLFRRWRSALQGAGSGQPVVTRATPAAEGAVPFIDLGDLRSGGSRVEVRLDLGAGIVLSIARS
jgi:hypothetical protein